MRFNARSIRFAVLVLTAAALVGACSATPAKPTVTIRGQTCEYAGPQQLPSKATLTWDLQDSEPTMVFEYAVVGLRDGKSAEDLRALKGVEGAVTFMDIAPEWTVLVDSGYIPSTMTTTSEYDLSENAGYSGGPLYVVCLSKAAPFDVLGPFEVAQ